MDNILSFASARIQEQERLPEVNPVLEQQIRDLGVSIAKAEIENIQNLPIDDFISTLEGVPASQSLKVMVDMLGSPNGLVVRDSIMKTRASLTRLEYYEKLKVFAEVFTPVRVNRINETASQISRLWGWNNA